MIFIDEFAGQLGNRLFQLAAAINLARRNLDHVAFPEWKYNECFEGLVANKTTSAPTASYKEPHFHYAPIPYNRNMLISGYFQSEKYFIQSEVEIRRQFRIKPEYAQTLNNTPSKILHMGYDTCSIHVRRGDFAQFPDHHPMLEMDYFNRAIDLITTSNKHTNFFIFSDDLDWCREQFPKTEQFTIMSGSVMEDFAAMSQCDHHIISNSSYSWWAAWLNPNRKKKVIAPSRWFGSALSFHDTKDLIPSSWITI